MREGNKHVFNGTLNLASKLFQIEGNADLSAYLFIYSKAYIKLTPVDKSAPITFEYNITPKSSQEYQLIGSVHHMEKYVYFTADLTAVDILNWDGTLEVSNEFV